MNNKINNTFKRVDSFDPSQNQFVDYVNKQAWYSEASGSQGLEMSRNMITNLSGLPKDGCIYHENRAKNTAKAAENVTKNKFLCHIGCHTGIVTQQFSKNCSKILALDIEEHHCKETLERKYSCPVDVKKMDAIKYLQENPDVNPEVFYMWMNYKAMQPWIDKVMDVRGHTNPTIILGIGLQKVVSPVKNGQPLQLVTARKIKERYKGSIKLVSFPIISSMKSDENDFVEKGGAFGILVLKGLK
tara:strand:- start:190 stop:921 length:732 start_codon:yes stop_codon:yes gene_type:complete